ncbi:replication protein RepA [Methylovulum psychrotolerans]|uniref:Uncharacterized protein n=1 Tax=Methylovulum psychrotolerans TaxID=1704499 RepID=A0A2S5CIQ9_9GAMM|nr:replication protein RepA [Methylovulum psychrotolerans]POZ50679.1 hypothetical protein AADEFJLK_03576 [Methylovulum psychrotolerans]
MADYTRPNKKSGNKCGHNPASPRYFSPPEKHAPRPKLLPVAIIRVTVYFSDPSILPTLNAANGSERQQRSERRESCIAILSCILHYMDLITLRVGIPQADGSMQGLTMPYLAELSGLGERRAERAIHDLKAAGIITVHPICEKVSDTVYKGVAAIRTVSMKLFVILGLDAWLNHERRRAVERKADKQAKRDRKAAAHVRMAMGAQRDKPAPKTTPSGNGRANQMAHVATFLSNARDILKPDTS